MDLSQRLDEMELAIHKPSFRKGTGRANEVNYWVFDYPPEKELEVRERVEYLKTFNFQLYYNRAQNYDIQTQLLLSVGLTYTFKNK